MIGSGLLLGLAGALLTSGALESFLFGLPVIDPPTHAAAAILVAVVSLVTCVVPMARALATSPMEILRG